MVIYYSNSRKLTCVTCELSYICTSSALTEFHVHSWWLTINDCRLTERHCMIIVKVRAAITVLALKWRQWTILKTSVKHKSLISDFPMLNMDSRPRDGQALRFLWICYLEGGLLHQIHVLFKSVFSHLHTIYLLFLNESCSIISRGEDSR